MFKNIFKKTKYHYFFYYEIGKKGSELQRDAAIKGAINLREARKALFILENINIDTDYSEKITIKFIYREKVK